ncbi:MAG: hypothetical protein HUU49_04175 [Candidatus Buchananbacteria bacterium]|nr:hypothetical protein [Candidatus Buchananbacteria bacterium]
MIDYLKYFFDPAHFLTVRPPAMSFRAIAVLAIFFAAIILVGVAGKLIERKTKDGLKVKAYRRIFNFGLTMGILGYLYLFFAWQGVVLLSARFLLAIWLLTLLLWLGFIIKYLVLDVPKLRKNIDEKRAFNKYIP